MLGRGQRNCHPAARPCFQHGRWRGGALQTGDHARSRDGFPPRDHLGDGRQQQATFQPLANEAGHAPSAPTIPWWRKTRTRSFSILGMRANPERLDVKLVPNEPLSGQIQIRNLGEVPITGLVATPNTPAGVSVQLSITNQLSGMSTGLLSYTISSTITQQANATFSNGITSAEGATLNVPGSAACRCARNRSPRPRSWPVASCGTRRPLCPSKSRTWAVRQAVICAPSCLHSMALAGHTNVASLLPGRKTTVTLALNPPADLPLTRYDGNLVLAGARTGVSVPFQFRALSVAVGDLNVSVTDEYTYFVAGAPGHERHRASARRHYRQRRRAGEDRQLGRNFPWPTSLKGLATKSRRTNTRASVDPSRLFRELRTRRRHSSRARR